MFFFEKLGFEFWVSNEFVSILCRAWVKTVRLLSNDKSNPLFSAAVMFWAFMFLLLNMRLGLINEFLEPIQI